VSSTSQLTILVPAYNEAESVADTVRSLLEQTVPPDEIIVIDDCSTDATAEVAAAAGATVVRPPQNTGSKAGAQMFALPLVRTEFVMAIDADTTLAPDAIELLAPAFEAGSVVAACGFVLPRYANTVWERGRYVEYMISFTFFKQVQDSYGKPLISSGCFSMYRTDELREIGGWSMQTVAEDMDLTWRFYQAGHDVRFVPEAVSYPIEPHDYDFLSKQLRRWSHGFAQNVRLHWRGVMRLGFLRSMVALALWDAVLASLTFLAILPALAVLVTPWALLGYVVDAPVVLIPLLAGARRRREVGRALASFPSYFVLRFVNCTFMLRALFREFVVRRPLLVYEKGH
jgi:poly-beta-1,6-N-acetyl-D-glucosamine synthase